MPSFKLISEVRAVWELCPRTLQLPEVPRIGRYSHDMVLIHWILNQYNIHILKLLIFLSYHVNYYVKGTNHQFSLGIFIPDFTPKLIIFQVY